MSTPPTANTRRLYRTCHNLNLRTDSFVNTRWLYPTSLTYKSTLDYVNQSDETLAKHYVAGEHVEDDRDYTDQELDMRLEAPPFMPEFDEDDGLLRNVPPAKSTTLGQLGQLRLRAVDCRLCEEIVEQVRIHDQELTCDRDKGT